MEKLGSLVLKHKKTILILVIVLTAFFGYEMRTLVIKDDVTKYPPQNDPIVKQYADLAEEFGINSIVMVGFDIEESENLVKIDEITNEIAKVENVLQVTSLTNVPIVESTEDGIQISTVSDKLRRGPVDLESLAKNETLKDKFISSDGKAAFMIVSMDGDNKDETYLAVKSGIENIYGDKTHFFGISPVDDSVRTITRRNLSKLVPIALLIVAVILAISFRTILGAIVPLVTVGISVVWCMGLIALFDLQLTVANSVIPVILIAIGTAYSVHVINKFYEETGTKEERVVNTSKDIGLAVILSGFTTAGGFLSLLTADIGPVVTMGIFSAVGVMIANILSLTFVPSLMYYFNPKPRKIKEGDLGRKKLTNPYVVIISLFAIIAALSPFALNLGTDMDIVNSIKKDEKIILDRDFIAGHFGGADYIFVDVKGDFKDPALLQTMANVQEKIKTVPGVTRAYSIVDLMKALADSFCGFSGIPSSEDEVNNLWFFLQGNDAIYSVINRDLERGIIQVTLNTNSIDEIKNISDEIDSIINKTSLGYEVVSGDSIENIADFMAPELKVSSGLYIDSYRKVMETPFGELVSANSNEVLEAMKYTSEFGMYDLDDESIARLLTATKDLDNGEYEDFSEAFEGIIDDYDDFAYDLSNALFINTRKWKTNMFADLLNVEKNDKNIQYLLPVAEDKAFIPGGEKRLSMTHTGTPEIMIHVSDLLFNNQYESMILTLIIVFILFYLQFRSIKIALIGIIPSILTVILNFEFMGIMGITLNTATISIAAIAIGAGIDYAIHFVNRFSVEYEKVGDKRAAVSRTFYTSGRGILLNALAVAFGFFALSFSDIAIIRDFGMLTGIALLIAAFITLLFLSSAYLIMKNVKTRK